MSSEVACEAVALCESLETSLDIIGCCRPTQPTLFRPMPRSKLTKFGPPEVCPVCGADVPRDSLACPECGADHNSGWREDADTYDAVDLPEDFNYDEVIRKEFGAGPKRGGLKTVWWLAAIVLIIVFIVIYFYAAR
jgi:predicted nucleic acid-binding Zn ribbon protein